VASAGPYASLHLDSDRQPCQHPTTQFLQAGRPYCRPTNSIKALKAADDITMKIHYYSQQSVKQKSAGIDMQRNYVNVTQCIN